MQPATPTPARGLRDFFNRTAHNRQAGIDVRYGYLASTLVFLVLAVAWLAFLAIRMDPVHASILWILVAMRASLARMVVLDPEYSFVFDDFIAIVGVFVLPLEQWAALALCTMIIFCTSARCALSIIGFAYTSLVWQLSLMLGTLPFAVWGHGIWAVIAGGTCGLFVANIAYSTSRMGAKVLNFGMPLGQALRATVTEFRDGFHESSAAEYGIGVPLAALCWTAFRYSPWAVLMVMVPYAMIWAMVRRNHAAQQVERELADARERIGRDSLSGLFNRERFTDAAVQALVASRREQRSVSLLMIDLDHFKQLNDTRGHQAGDAAIIGAAATMQTILTDAVIGRYGGEEFIALLTLAPDQAHELADQLRLDIADALNEYSTTASIGITHLTPTPATENDQPAHDYAWASETLEALTHQADTALYAAKHGGRNQVATWTGDVAAETAA